jgi:hypothetical protein
MVLVIFVLTSFIDREAVNAQGEHELLEELRQSWSVLPPANYSRRTTWEMNDGSISATEGRIASAVGCSLDIQGQSDGSQRVRVRNPDYWFEARRLGKDREWVLSAYGEGEFPAKFAKEWETMAVPGLYPSASLTVRLLELLNSDNVKVSVVSYDSAANEAELQLEVKEPSMPIAESGAMARFVSARIKLRKLGEWALTEYEMDTQHRKGEKGVLENWVDCGNGVMIPMKWTGAFNGAPCESFRSDLTLGPLSDTREFTLEAFGLPMPGKVSTGWAISYYWLGAIGVLLLVIAGWMQFRAVQ